MPVELNDQQRLIERLKRIDALFADRAATPGERAAAKEARERIQQRLAAPGPNRPANRIHVHPAQSLVEKTLCGPAPGAMTSGPTVTPDSVILRSWPGSPPGSLTETLWPEFVELDRTLQTYLTEETNRIIAESINKDSSDVEVRSGQALPASASMDAG